MLGHLNKGRKRREIINSRPTSLNKIRIQENKTRAQTKVVILVQSTKITIDLMDHNIDKAGNVTIGLNLIILDNTEMMVVLISTQDGSMIMVLTNSPDGIIAHKTRGKTDTDSATDLSTFRTPLERVF